MDYELEQKLIEEMKTYIKNGCSFELFLGEYGWSDWMADYCEDWELEDGAELSDRTTNLIDDMLHNLWYKAEESVMFSVKLGKVIEQSQQTMKAVSEELGIPYRTIQDWKAGRRTPSAYIQNAIIDQIKALN